MKRLRRVVPYTVEKMSFDPFGKRRNSNDWTYNNVPLTFKFDRGYTGHEHLDEFDLINMNGRCYDPSLARFISPDPFVQDFSSTQNLNRYSYALNNPLIFTDPSGYNYKPIDWNKPPTGGIAFNAGYRGNMGPGSGNHWSDAYRSEYGNFMLGNASSYDKMYGEGAWAQTLDFMSLGDDGALDRWSQGFTSLENGIYIQVSSDKIVGSNLWMGFNTTNNLSGNEVLCVKVSFGNKNQGQGANFDNSSLAIDIGGGIFGGLSKAVTPGDKWLGINGKYYANSWGGNQHTGSRSGALATSKGYTWAGRATIGATVILGGVQVYNGIQLDGGQFGYNANLAGARATGSIVGGWAGAEAGAYAFGILGGCIGGPPGAVIGAVIGGFVGGLTGSFVGDDIGTMGINFYYDK